MSVPENDQTRHKPTRTLSIVGIVFAVLIPIVGLIISLIARNRAKDRGVEDNLATFGIVLSAVLLVIEAIVGIIVTVSAINAG